MFEKLGLPLAITIERITWATTGLDAHAITLWSTHEDYDTGKFLTLRTALDYHWQEATAWECADRWAKRYDVPIKVAVHFQERTGNE